MTSGTANRCSDYKWRYQMEAEELAFERFGKDFYDLPDDMQYAIYQEAIKHDTERILSAAENAQEEIA